MRTGDVKQLVRHLYRPAVWVLVAVMLVATLAAIAPARAASPSYTLYGSAAQPGGSPVPAGAQVDLVSRATGAVFTTLVGGGGQFTFTTSSTGGALAPGYWGVWVPVQTNVTLGSCKPCAILPQNDSPTWVFENATTLTSVASSVSLNGIAAYQYSGELKGTVYDNGEAAPGAGIALLAPNYNSVALANNTTNASGGYTLKVPLGNWILETTVPGPTTYYNYTTVNVTKRTATVVDTNVTTSYLVYGYSYQAANPNAKVPYGGNATLYDPTTGYIYSRATAGGFYSLGTYPGNFTHGTQPFDVILSNIGYRTQWFALNISSPTPIKHNVLAAAQTPATLGGYNTTLNFTGVNVATGNGTVAVKTIANLGNDTVFSTLANGSVGQLWGQLGLDLAHSTVFPSADLSQVYSWVNASGPFFSLAASQTTVNGTGFANPTAPQVLSSWGSTCTTTTCGLNSSANITLGWTGSYKLNGSIPKNSSSYAISFNFKHPSSAEAYNYTVVLPTGYVLAAGTAAPSRSVLVPKGADNTWTKFNLESLPSSSSSGTAKFNIVKAANMTVNVNVTTKSFTFSTQNVLNATHGNYTVIVGVGQNVSFSALNSTYPAGTNGTKFVWNFGDGSSPMTTYIATTNHTYTTASGATNDSGSVTVTSSGGQVNSTKFYVWVAEGPVTAGIAVNASAYQTRSAGSTTYYMLNWSDSLSFNSTPSKALISGSAPANVQNVISISAYSLVGRGFKYATAANFSWGQGQNASKDYSYQFLGAGAYIVNTTINGVNVVFKGWQYNVTLKVWDGSGQSASTTVIVLVSDTQKPTPAFNILNSAGKIVGGSGIQVGTNLTAKVQLNASNATDPNNGSIVKYAWQITNSGNSSVNITRNTTTVRPFPTLWLNPQSKAYTVNLTVWDRNGNSQWTTQSLQVSTNSTYNVIMAANNLTAPTSYTQGTTYTLWVNVTVGGGSKATAESVVVKWYLLGPSGSGSPSYIGGSPGSVKFYNYSGGVVNTAPQYTGTIPSLAFNTTLRAEITWDPGASGNYLLYANVTASNEWAGDIPSGPGVVSQSISVSANPTTQLLEYVAIAVAVVVVILLIIFFYRRRGRTPTTKSTSGKAGLERGGKKPADDDEDEDDEK
jgi:hypothetical protein